MKTCPQCHSDNPDDVKFCDNCGGRLPDRTCAKCHSPVRENARFCHECGTALQGCNSNVSHGGSVGIGDKNVIAGDVVGTLENFKIAGNATIIKNSDEAGKIVQCHLCGRNLTLAGSYSCSACGEKVCPDCFKTEQQICVKCFDKRQSDKEDVYRRSLAGILSDGIIDLGERKALNELAKQLGISASRTTEIESEMRAEMQTTASGHRDGLSTFETHSLRKATEAFYENGEWELALRIVEPIKRKHPENEDVLSLFLAALAVSEPVRALEEACLINADVLGSELVKLDVFLALNRIDDAEQELGKAEVIWPDDKRLKCRRALFWIVMARVTEDDSFLDFARETVADLQQETNKSIRSLVAFVQRRMNAGTATLSPGIPRSRCEQEDLYFAIANGLVFPREKGPNS